MATEIIMPKLGLTMTEGTVFEWLKHEGDEVKKGETVATINSEKLTADVDAPADGVLLKIVVQEGEDAKCKAPIAYLGEKGEQAADTKQPAETTQEATAAAPVAGSAPTSPAEENVEQKRKSPAAGARIFITPLARKIAAEQGIDYSKIAGSGGNGRITRRDVESYAASQPTVAAPGQTQTAGVEVGQGLAGMRKVIAQRMMGSLQTTAQVTLHAKADITSLMAFRKELKQKVAHPLTSGQLSLTTLVTRAAILALKDTPDMNAWYQNGQFTHNEDVNIGMAVAVSAGLMVPVVKRAQTMTLTELGENLARVITGTRQGTLAGDLYTGGTFTISNLGKSGVEYFTPIINTPETGILGVGTLLQELQLDETGKLVQAVKLPLSLTFDHQVIDGSPAADFLAKIVAFLEDPYTLVL